MPHADIVIIGAGLSGIGIALHLSKSCPEKSIIIIEGRSDLGGTWDLFKYPGIRSDSDMLTFSFGDQPWDEDRILSPGGMIKQYIDDSATKAGLKSRIRFNTKVLSANFSSKDAKWSFEAEQNGKPISFSSNFFINATGYYNYEQGFAPDFPGQEKFKGKIIHPQHWPEKNQYENKRYVVIGSGATAVTLVPNLVKLGAHVTMLQRTPTYLFSLPLVDGIYKWLRWLLPLKLAFFLARWRLILKQYVSYWVIRRFPNFFAWMFKALIKRQLRGSSVDAEVHFNPPYKPWDQRLCIVPDNDLFKCLKDGSAEIVTDKILQFDETGIELVSGQHIDADVIVSATGLNLRILGGIKLMVDGKEQHPGKAVLYKGVMTGGIPNFANILGYINQSWTLKVDLCGAYLSKLINEMDKRNARTAVVDVSKVKVTDEPVMGQLTAAYVLRARDHLPKQGDKPEFIVANDYLADRRALLHPNFDDEYLVFK